MGRWTKSLGSAITRMDQESNLSGGMLEAAARHDRVVIAGALGIITLLSWASLLSGGGMDMSSSMDMNMVMPANWSLPYAIVVFVMWWVMMIAMMLPSVAPMILLFAMVNRRSHEVGAPYVPTAAFASGYLVAWGGFSLAATLVHWWLGQAGWLTMAMASANHWLSGALLIAAGLYQLTPLKRACLRHCRGPIEFISRHWRPGHVGALRMGLVHGSYCVGCCWVVMGLLFYGGVMNLYWIVGLAVLILLEKLLPAGPRLGNISGVGFLVWGFWILVFAA